MSKTSSPNWDSIASQFGLPLSSELTSLKTPASPTFPTVEELIRLDSEASRPSSSKKGFFEELLQSRPEAMYLDTLDHPEKYTGEVKQLLEEITLQRRAPTDEERVLLDRAVLDFLAKPKAPPPPSPKKRTEPMEPVTGSEEAFPETAQDPVSTGEPPPFWWL